MTSHWALTTLPHEPQLLESVLKSGGAAVSVALVIIVTVGVKYAVASTYTNELDYSFKREGTRLTDSVRVSS